MFLFNVYFIYLFFNFTYLSILFIYFIFIILFFIFHLFFLFLFYFIFYFIYLFLRENKAWLFSQMFSLKNKALPFWASAVYICLDGAFSYAADTWRLYNVVSTSMQRHDVASTLRRRCIDVLCLLGALVGRLSLSAD